VREGGAVREGGVSISRFVNGVTRAVPSSLCSQVIAKHGPKLTPAALEAMTYADAVIK
jgi:hypothetical protein